MLGHDLGIMFSSSYGLLLGFSCASEPESIERVLVISYCDYSNSVLLLRVQIPQTFGVLPPWNVEMFDLESAKQIASFENGIFYDHQK